jgi:hypothetical protein
MFPLDVKMGQLSAAASQSMLIRFVSNKVFLPAFSLVSSLWALPRPTSFYTCENFRFRSLNVFRRPSLTSPFS